MRKPWQISRRTFLGGAGAMIALPWLEAMIVPKQAMAQAGFGLNRRLLFFYVPNGIHMAAWTPEAAGADYTMTPILAPLEGNRDQLLVLSGLANEPARPDGPGDHAAGTGSFLTATHVYKTEGADIQNAISVDQVAANALGGDTSFASLQLGIEGGASVGGCDSGYSCAYSRNISWAGPQTPLPKIVNPRLLFDRMFSGYDPEASAEQAQLRRELRTSVLDYGLERANSLSGRLGSSDQQRLDEYMTGVRELEVRIDDQASAPVCVPPEAPMDDITYLETIDLMGDLIALAYRCDLTRFVTFMLGNAGSGRAHTHLGISEGHHDISHHQSLETNYAKLQTIDTWEIEVFSGFLDRLRAIEDGPDQTVLDNAIVMFSSEIEDGNSHRHYNLPVLLAGSGGGSITPGRHVRVADEEPIANLFTSLLHSVGVENETFGDNGTGPLDDLA